MKMCDKEVFLKICKVRQSLAALRRAEGICPALMECMVCFLCIKGFYQLVLCVHMCVCVKLIYLSKIPWIIISWNMQNAQLAMRGIQHFT